MILGYKGTLDFAYTVLDTVRNRSFEKNISVHQLFAKIEKGIIDVAEGRIS